MANHLSTSAVLNALVFRQQEMYPDINRDVYKESRELDALYKTGLSKLLKFVERRGPNLEEQLNNFELPEHVLIHISELVTGNDGVKGVEILNLAPRPFNLAGYTLTDDPTEPLKWQIGHVTIPARGRHVATLPEIIPHGTLIALVNSINEIALVDTASTPSILPDGYGFGRVPETSGRWRILDAPSPDEPNQWKSPIHITVAINEQVVIPGDNVSLQITVKNEVAWQISGKLRIDITTRSGIPDSRNPWMEYQIIVEEMGSREINISHMLPQNTLSINGYNMLIRFMVNDNDEWARDIREFFITGEPKWPIVINEIMAVNDSTIFDEFGEFDDWVELYNASDKKVDLVGLYLTDNVKNTPLLWPLPNISIGPYEKLIVWCDKDNEQGQFHANFKLSGDGDEIAIVEELEDGNTLVRNRWRFGVQQADVSIGRFPDANPSWVVLDEPSPLEVNIYTSP